MIHTVMAMKSRRIPKDSIITRFLVCLLLVMILPFSLLLVLTSREVERSETRQVSQILSGSLEVIALNVDNRLSSLEALYPDLLLDTSFTTAVQRLAPYVDDPTYTDFTRVRTIKNALTDTAIRSDDIRNIYLYTPTASRLFISDVNWNPAFNDCTLDNTDWMQSFESRDSDYPWVISKALQSDEVILSSYRTIQQFQQPLSGILSINASPEALLNVIAQSNTYTEGLCFFMDHDGHPVADDAINPELLQRLIKECPTAGVSKFLPLAWQGEDLYVQYHTSEYSGFTYVLCVPKTIVYDAASRVQRVLLWYGADALLILSIFILLSFFFFLRPIRRLSGSMRQSQEGDFSVRLPEHRKDEIGEIFHRFNRMNESIAQLIDENYIKELHKRDTELKLVTNQINEHFLYNTLDSIHWIAKRNHDEVVSQAIRSLGTFYRLSLSNGADTILVQDLEQMLEHYLFIQQLRLGDALQYDIQISPELFERSVPKYLFIPLVENAVSHGLKGLGGIVCVSLLRTPSGMRFRVSDNGRGISAQRLVEIRNILHSDTSDITGCFALKNLNTQLALYYSNREGVQLQSEEGRGTVAWFDIPEKEESPHGSHDHC